MFIVARSQTTTNRSVDILGLSSEFENNYLNEIMPGFSVLTIRFSYFGFICWAISKGVNPRSDDFRSLEYALARTEYKVPHRGRFKGIRNIKRGIIPPYQQSIFYDYRKTMERMGVIDEKDELTQEGKGLAELFMDKSKLDRVPRNLDFVARNGFDGIKRSLLKLSKDERNDYQNIFFNGVDNNSDSKEQAKKRKKHKPLYEYLLRKYKDDEDEDNAGKDVIDLLIEKTKGDNKYKLAYEMSYYLAMSYYCMKTLHELYKYIQSLKKKEIEAPNAVKIKNVRECLDEIFELKKQQWFKKSLAKKLHDLCSAHTHKNLLIKLIERNEYSKREKAWFKLVNKEVIRLNPNDPPVPKDSPSFGIRLVPFGSLIGDL